MKEAIKRHTSIQPLSREHHHGLLLCWKIRTGLKKEIPFLRINEYVLWFYHSQLLPHFEAEETLLFPILGMDHEMVKRAMAEHRRLRRLSESLNEHPNNLSMIEEELESHIRFEERVLFNEIQQVASEEQLHLIDTLHDELKLIDTWEDRFWEQK